MAEQHWIVLEDPHTNRGRKKEPNQKKGCMQELANDVKTQWRGRRKSVWDPRKPYSSFTELSSQSTPSENMKIMPSIAFLCLCVTERERERESEAKQILKRKK